MNSFETQLLDRLERIEERLSSIENKLDRFENATSNNKVIKHIPPVKSIFPDTNPNTFDETRKKLENDRKIQIEQERIEKERREAESERKRREELNAKRSALIGGLINNNESADPGSSLFGDTGQNDRAGGLFD